MTRQDDRDMKCGRGEGGRWKKLLFCLGLQGSGYTPGRSGGEQLSDYRCTVMLLLLRCIGNLLFCVVVFLFITNTGMFIWYLYYQDCPLWWCYGNHHHIHLGWMQTRRISSWYVLVIEQSVCLLYVISVAGGNDQKISSKG